MRNPSRILLLVVLTLVACGASARQRTISATLLGVDTAKSAFVAFDGAHQLQLVEAATSKEVGAAKLASYRDRRVKLVVAFEGAYRSLAIAAILNDDPSSLANLVAAAKVALDEWRSLQAELGGGAP